jgi:4-hydroxythreonine-4-phosphate dehydrogenase
MDAEKRQRALEEKPVVGISIGDINGIGPEVIIKSLQDQRILNHITPVIFGSTKVLSYYKKMLEIDDFHYSQVKEPNMISSRKINVVNCWSDMKEINVGEVRPEGGECALLSLDAAVEYLREGHIDALCTAPINKDNMQSDAFTFAGHTEYIAGQFGAQAYLMLMVSDGLRVGLVSAHTPLKEVYKEITRERVEMKLKVLIKSMSEDFGIDKPKIAVLGLNPHAGENGLLGSEEEEVIAPAVETLRNAGQLVFGPFASDGFFGTMQFKQFDAVLAMYHDQGLIPFKLLAFERGVNYTAGIPVVRTSPDHGTAYNLAGKNTASPESMREAIYLAADIARQRMANVEVA